jgi:hypothetical protein
MIIAPSHLGHQDSVDELQPVTLGKYTRLDQRVILLERHPVKRPGKDGRRLGVRRLDGLRRDGDRGHGRGSLNQAVRTNDRVEAHRGLAQITSISGT